MFIGAVGIGGSRGLHRLVTGGAARGCLREAAGLAMGIAFSGSMAGALPWADQGRPGAVARSPSALRRRAGGADAWGWRAHPTRPRCPRRASAGGHGAAQRVADRGVRALWALAVFAVPPLFGYLAPPCTRFTSPPAAGGRALVLLAIGGLLGESGRALAGLPRIVSARQRGSSFSCSIVGCCVSSGWKRGRAALRLRVRVLPLPAARPRATIVSVLLSTSPTAIRTVWLSASGTATAARPVDVGLAHDVTASYVVIYLWATGLAVAGCGAVGLRRTARPRACSAAPGRAVPRRPA